MDRMYNQQLVFKKIEDALVVSELLVKEGYVVMLSREEQFTILNYLRTFPDSDRNSVVFMNRDEFEEEFF